MTIDLAPWTVTLHDALHVFGIGSVASDAVQGRMLCRHSELIGAATASQGWALVHALRGEDVAPEHRAAADSLVRALREIEARHASGPADSLPW